MLVSISVHSWFYINHLIVLYHLRKNHKDSCQSALTIGISVNRSIVEPKGINVFCSAGPSGVNDDGCGAAIARLFSWIAHGIRAIGMVIVMGGRSSANGISGNGCSSTPIGCPAKP